MNRETRKPGAAAKGPAERGKPKPESSGAPSLTDDEFHDFFSKGDIGDYEGGVAYSQPPSKIAEIHLDEPAIRMVTAEQRARRAFFTRVVGGVVAGCVVLLLVAAQFRGHEGNTGLAVSERVMAAQPASRPSTPLLGPSARTLEQRLPARAEPEPTRVKEVAAQDSPVTEQKQIAAPEASAPSIEPAPQLSPALVVAQTKTAPANVAPAAAEARSATSSRGMKLAARPVSKAGTTVLPEIKPPVTTPAATKQSFAAFPVD